MHTGMSTSPLYGITEAKTDVSAGKLSPASTASGTCVAVSSSLMRRLLHQPSTGHAGYCPVNFAMSPCTSTMWPIPRSPISARATSLRHCRDSKAITGELRASASRAASSP